MTTTVVTIPMTTAVVKKFPDRLPSDSG